MALQVSTIRPGIVVTLHTSVRGNVSYAKRNIDDKTTPEGKHVVEWETKRTIDDPTEFEEASKVRSKARNTISLQCVVTPTLGLLCPRENEEKLEEAIKEARRVVRAFNRQATITRVNLSVILSRIVDNDVEATRAINAEIAGLMRLMQQGIENVDAASIRKAALNALSVSKMLTPDASEKVKEFVTLAREQARKIVKAGETVSVEIDKAVLDNLRSKRTAFLDMDDKDDLQAPVIANNRAIEVDAEDNKPVVSKPPIPRVRLKTTAGPKARSAEDFIDSIRKAAANPKPATKEMIGIAEEIGVSPNTIAAGVAVQEEINKISKKTKSSRARLVDMN